ncbi:MAG: aldose 1-epimerase [Cyanobacteriota bacterium ELA615]
MYTHGRKDGCRLSLDYTYKGMKVAFLQNDLLRVGVLVSKGGDIFEFTYKPRDLDFMWQSPISMRQPYIATSALPEGNFHDYYYGGWQEVLPSAGWSNDPYKGSSQGLHGEVSLLPFDVQVIEDSPEQVSIAIEARLYRSPLILTRTMTIKRDISALFIHERLINESPFDFAIMWGHHPALGQPFLDDTCFVQTPATKFEVMNFHHNGLWETNKEFDYPLGINRRTNELEDISKIRGFDSQSVDVVFLKELTDGWFGVTNQSKEIGFGMAWDKELFKYLWMWQNYGGNDDYPWYGRAYTCALEPFTSFPPAGINTAIKNGTAHIMKPNQVIETDLVAVAYLGNGVNKVNIDGTVS